MDKETLSHYGWIVVLVLILSVMIAMATPFGNFIANGFKATYNGIYNTSDKAMNIALGAVGVKNTYDCGHDKSESGDHSQAECGHYVCEDCDCTPALCGIEGHWSGDGLDHTVINHADHTYACQCSGWTVPEGGTYTMINAINEKSIYNEGEQLPCGYQTQSRDIYSFGNYQYNYNQYYSYYGTWTGNNAQNGWGVRCINNTANPGAILESINGQPIVNLDYTFHNNTDLTTAPIIPQSVTSMSNTFNACTNLKTYAGSTDADGDFSKYIMPPNVKNTYCIFINCTSLMVAPIFPDSVTDMTNAFTGCTSLTTAPKIPDKVVGLFNAFYNCKNLKTYHGSTDPDGDFSNYKIPSSVTNMNGTFCYCNLLTIAPDMSNASSVTDMGNTFKGCTSLTTAPIIPNSVTYMRETFSGCTALITTPTIPNGVTSIESIFSGCSSLTVAPIIPNGVTNMFNAFAGCSSIKTYTGSTDSDGDFSGYKIPNSVTDLRGTFQKCKNFIIAPDISNATNVTSLLHTFDGCTSLTTIATIPSSVKDMNATFQGCESLNCVISLPCSIEDTSWMLNKCPATVTYYHVDNCDGSCGK